MSQLSAWVTEAHNRLLSHLMTKTKCCAALHGRYCPNGKRLQRQYQGRFWADYVMRGEGKAARQQRLMAVPSDYLRRVKRLALVIHRQRGGHE